MSSDRLEKFLADNADLPQETNGVRIRPEVNEEGHLHIVLVIGNARVSDINAAMTLVTKWRKRILAFDDLFLLPGDAIMTYIVDEMIPLGSTSKILAQFINLKIEENVRNFASTKVEAHFWSACSWLALCGYPKKRARETIENAIEEMGEGREPFWNGQPVDAQRVGEKIRKWTASRDHRRARAAEKK